MTKPFTKYIYKSIKSLKAVKVIRNQFVFTMLEQEFTHLKILVSSAAPVLNGKIVGLSGGALSGLPSNPVSTIVASTSDNTKNECQCVYGKRNMQSNKSS